MDFTKFVSLLSKQALFFPTVSTLKNSDIWEGSWTNFEFAEYVGMDKSSIDTTKARFLPSMSEFACKHVAVSCWHMNDIESMAMWKLYLSTDKEGIAIRTSFGRLKGCFIFNHVDWPVWDKNFNSRPVAVIAGQVEYVDWENLLPNTNTVKQIFYKGKSFEHEKELRIIAQLYPFVGTLPSMLNDAGETVEDPMLYLTEELRIQIDKYGGVYLPVKLNELIENVYVTPFAPLWFQELVEMTLKQHDMVTKPICSNKKPLW